MTTTTIGAAAALDWVSIAADRIADLADRAALNGVEFSDQESERLVALSIRLDIERGKAMLETMISPATQVEPKPRQRRVRLGPITALGAAEQQPTRGYLLLRKGNQAWLVPDRPDGWDHREPWSGDINSVRWIGGPQAVAAFRYVGAPV